MLPTSELPLENFSARTRHGRCLRNGTLSRTRPLRLPGVGGYWYQLMVDDGCIIGQLYMIVYDCMPTVLALRLRMCKVRVLSATDCFGCLRIRSSCLAWDCTLCSTSIRVFLASKNFWELITATPPTWKSVNPLLYSNLLNVRAQFTGPGWG